MGLEFQLVAEDGNGTGRTDHVRHEVGGRTTGAVVIRARVADSWGGTSDTTVTTGTPLELRFSTAA